LKALPNIDAVFVLSVKTFHDRIAHVRRELDRHQIAFEFIFDFDRDAIDRETLDRHFGSGPLQPAAASLVLKHLHAWRLTCARGLSRVLVLEDDVILHRDFRAMMERSVEATLALAPGWLVYIGGAGASVPDQMFLHSGPLFRLNNDATSEGYITDREACRRRIAWCEENLIRQPADHLILAIDQAVGTAHYWTVEALVEQGSMTGLFHSSTQAG
jgi:glycosyl transferase family 25